MTPVYQSYEAILHDWEITMRVRKIDKRYSCLKMTHWISKQATLNDDLKLIYSL